MRGVSPPSTSTSSKASSVVCHSPSGDVAVVQIVGLVDEKFAGFGDVGSAKALVIDVSRMTRMTSFGVRQWMKGMEAVPKTVTDRYLLGCPLFFIDQMNMVLNFAGGAQIITAVAPYTCPACATESSELVDLLAERATIARGAAPERMCQSCGGKLELDEAPESYFAFVPKHGATKLRDDVARQLAHLGLYMSRETIADKPPKVIKLIQGSVTYFRIIGTIASTFRARPFIVGAEGEVVLDVAEVQRCDSTGAHEWRKLVKSLATQVQAVTLVDVSQSFLAMAPDSFTVAKNVYVSSVLLPYRCADCGRRSQQSHPLTSPVPAGAQVCSTCGGNNVNELPANLLTPLHRYAVKPPPASAKMIERRDEILSRALTDAKVAEAGVDAASRPVDAADTVIGNYKIVRKLSAGGMAEVFLARQIGMDKPVAVKRIQRKFLESRHLAIDMFLNEAKIAGRLMHPNIVQVLDVGEVGGALYLAMEYVRGKDLRDACKMLQANGEMMPLGVACYIIRDVALALHHAYWTQDLEGKQMAVVHRDVSPHNVILSFDGAVKLLDFGVAMSSVTEQEEQMIVGKWMYMSPEHTTPAIDHRSDLFSLGVVMYLLCSGRMPFSAATEGEITEHIEDGRYPRLTGVPPALSQLVDSLLAPDPDDRPQTGQAVAAAINEIMRANHLEAGAGELAEFLNQLFLYELAAIEATTNATATLLDDVVMDVMDITTIKLALGSGTTQAQGTPATGMSSARPPAVTPTGLLAASPGPSEVSFTPIAPAAPKARSRAALIWLVSAGVIVLGILALLLARFLG